MSTDGDTRGLIALLENIRIVLKMTERVCYRLKKTESRKVIDNTYYDDKVVTSDDS